MVDHGNNHNRVLKYLPLLALFLVFGLFVWFEGYTLFDLAVLKAYHQLIAEAIQENFWLYLLGFISIYTISTAISFPGATILSLLGGYFFGTLYGGLGIVIGATTGATLLFLAAKLAFSDFLRPKVAPYIKRFEKGFQEDAVSYLLMLRLMPIFPFFVVNLVPAFLNVTFGIYVVTTFFGILPASFIYAGLGAAVDNLLELESLNLSFFGRPEIWMPLAGLALLSFLPVLFKRARKGRMK